MPTPRCRPRDTDWPPGLSGLYMELPELTLLGGSPPAWDPSLSPRSLSVLSQAACLWTRRVPMVTAGHIA